ncbi:hypothetical protein GALMADRAFT_224061 [Galerina marginata CBS 339.88]|uniref:Uncharacterized protein n=1 Tax=Galerina marginata (strain CBS 339.88) TaxID=685588 RepID=A0A067T8X9_GALM3|nr:hypothetical protein GALMADRAFT_224061 [Galerina marginata CBS 339.88]
MDVLNLSRTTKPLRAILLGSHARGVWRSALGGVRALPLCPPDLTEIKYASLAFDNWCQSCLAPNIEKILWECRVRYCKKCIKKHFIQEDELDLWIPEDVLIEKPDAIFPLAYVVQPRNRNTGNGRTKPVYLLSTVQEYLKELDEVDRAQDENALANWSQGKKGLQDMRISHAALCVYWDTHWAYRRSPRVSPSRLLEMMIIIILVVVLAFLWREKLLNAGL